MPTTDHSGKSLLARSRKPPSFLDELAFVMVATPAERKKMREKCRGGSKVASKEVKKRKRHTMTWGLSNDLEIVSGDGSVGKDMRHWAVVNRRHSQGWHEHRSIIEGSSVDASAETLTRRGENRRPLSLSCGEKILSTEEEYRRLGTITTDSDIEWDTAQSSLPSRVSGTAGRSSGYRVDPQETMEMIKRLSLVEPGERVTDKEVGQGSWRRDARHRRDDSQSRRSSFLTPPEQKGSFVARRPSPPGAWPRSSTRTQETGNSRRHTSLHHESRRSDRILVTDIVRGPEPVSTAGTSKKYVLVGEKDRKPCRGPPVPKMPIQQRNPNNIRPRRAKRSSSGNRHLRLGIPLTVANLTQYTVAGGGEKSYKAKSSGWMGCTGGDSDVESEASLWDGDAFHELDPWDSVSSRDFKHY